MMDRTWALAAVVVASLGCEVSNEGELGRFQLEGTRTESCGDSGLLASGAALTDTVLLRKGSQQSMQWTDKNGLMVLEIGEHGNDFTGQRVMVIDMRAGAMDPTLEPCSIQRIDRVEGLMEGDEKAGYSGFEAIVRYDFVPLEGSSCSDLHTPDVIATGVPCAISYDTVGSRVE